jgi:hypothetical protein
MGAAFECLDSGIQAAVCRQHQHKRFRVDLQNLLQKRYAILIRQLQIAEDNVEMFLFYQRQRGGS